MPSRALKYFMTLILPSSHTTQKSVAVVIPSDCDTYPCSGSDRLYVFQKLQIDDADHADVVHVAIECKIWKYDHVIHMATFRTEPESSYATLVCLESLSLSYEVDDVVTEPRVLHHSLVELRALMPAGVSVVNVDMSPPDDRIKKPSACFDCEFHGNLDKHTKIRLLGALPQSGTRNVVDQL